MPRVGGRALGSPLGDVLRRGNTTLGHHIDLSAGDELRLLNFDGEVRNRIYSTSGSLLDLWSNNQIMFRVVTKLSAIIGTGWHYSYVPMHLWNNIIKGVYNLCLNTSSTGLIPHRAAEGGVLLNYDDLGGTPVWVPPGGKPDGLGALGRHSLDKYMAFIDDFYYYDWPSHIWNVVLSGGGGVDVRDLAGGWVRLRTTGAGGDDVFVTGPFVCDEQNDFDISLRVESDTTGSALKYLGVWANNYNYVTVTWMGGDRVALQNRDIHGASYVLSTFYPPTNEPWTIRLQYSKSGGYTRAIFNDEVTVTSNEFLDFVGPFRAWAQLTVTSTGGPSYLGLDYYKAIQERGT